MKSIDDISFKNKKALVRVDFNVPLDENFNITDLTRIQAAEATIRKILNDGGSAVLMSHLGRPKGGPEDRFSLRHLVPELTSRFGANVRFVNDCVGPEVEKTVSMLEPGEILLLENLRFYKEETAGDKVFAEKLSRLGDIYVNDAFGTAHRAHASTTIVAGFFKDKVCGYVMKAELENAARVLGKGERPFTAIMGGAKISDKIQIVKKLLEVVDNLIIGGGMSYTFSKACGGEIGNSLLEEDKQEIALEIIQLAKEKGVNLLLPLDSVQADSFSNEARTKIVTAGEIERDWQGLDIGPETIRIFSETIKNSKTILWNGPMGVFEFPTFAKGTIAIAESVVAATSRGSFSLIGGGDSAAAINNLGYGERVSYVSTGGGALLEYMEGKVLPGVAALEE